MRYFSLLLFLGLGFSVQALSQPPNGEEKINNGENTTIPGYETEATDPLNYTPNETEESELESPQNDISFDLTDYEKSVVIEDLYGIDIGESEVFITSEEKNIGTYDDPQWVKIADYYAIWDSYYVNPYGSDASSFNKVIDIELYNPEKGQLWASPLEYTLQTSPFGPRWGRYHHGQDINLSYGEPVYAAFDGIVRIATYSQGYGNYVVIRHYNGLETLYGHFSALKVESEQKVKAGQLIGLGGSTGYSTGPHLHFEIRYEGNSINPNHIFDFTDPSNPQIRGQQFTLLPEHFVHYGNRVQTNIYHQVSLGETLQSISERYNISVTTLAQMNQLDENAELPLGTRLKVK